MVESSSTSKDLWFSTVPSLGEIPKQVTEESLEVRARRIFENEIIGALIHSGEASRSNIKIQTTYRTDGYADIPIPMLSLRIGTRSDSFSFEQTSSVQVVSTLHNPAGKWQSVTVNNGSYGRSDIYIKNGISFQAEEELLHAADSIARGELRIGNFNDVCYGSAVENAVHASMVFDALLTVAAKEIGIEEYEYWRNIASEQTRIDRGNIGLAYRYSFNSIRPTYPNTLLGKEVNERFQYPFTTRKDVEDMLKYYIHRMNVNWISSDRASFEGFESMHELIALTYGDHFFDLMMKLYEMTYEIQNRTAAQSIHDDEPQIDIEAVVNFGKTVLRNARQGASESQLVRHHNPLSNRPILRYEIESFDHDIEFMRTIGLPVLFTVDKLQNLTL